jgi:hypothetical protein
MNVFFCMTATWDSPPRSGEKGYEAFKKAFERYVFSRTVTIPKLSAAHAKSFDNRVKDDFRKRYALKDAVNLQLGQPSQFKLLPFQVTGFNWLCDNWWNHQPCILADEMGLVSRSPLPFRNLIYGLMNIGKNSSSDDFLRIHCEEMECSPGARRRSQFNHHELGT